MESLMKEQMMRSINSTKGRSEISFKSTKRSQRRKTKTQPMTKEEKARNLRQKNKRCELLRAEKVEVK